MYSSHRNADCKIRVCGQTFNCHRFVVQLASGYIQSLIENATDCEAPIDLDVPGVTARTFEYVMQFAYRGSVELDANVVGDVMKAADALSMSQLRVACVSFMTHSLSPDNCLRYWSHIESYDSTVDAERILYKNCLCMARSTFRRAIHSPRPLAGATDGMVETLLRDDEVNVRTLFFLSEKQAN